MGTPKYFQTPMNSLNILRIMIGNKKIYLMVTFGLILYYQKITETRKHKSHKKFKQNDRQFILVSNNNHILNIA